MKFHGKSDKIFSINNKIIWAAKRYKDTPTMFSGMSMRYLFLPFNSSKRKVPKVHAK